MSKFWLTIVPVVLLAVGCASKQTPSVLKPESEKIHVGMQPEEVTAIAGKPTMNISDPISGAAMWMYKDTTVGDHMTVQFNLEGVYKVVYGSS
ncbi:MAG: hypothetical protein QOJ65_1306 [Fimbriimonadaceae bacterium]|jgi:hypothetical protein|nr:hypothetical protein [Fimbriimonadaceae bacterium]